MKHRDAVPLLTDFASGGLEAETAELVAAHVDDCEPCRHWLAAYRSLGEALAPDSPHLSSVTLAEVASNDSLLGGLSSEQDHLQACAECRREFEVAREAFQYVRGEAPQRTFWQHVPWSTWKVAATLLLVLGLSLASIAFLGGGEPAAENLLLAERSLVGSQRIQTAGTMTATAVQVGAGAQIVMEAGDLVAFGEGFQVAADADLVVIAGDL